MSYIMSELFRFELVENSFNLMNELSQGPKLALYINLNCIAFSMNVLK
jgi:hypothetical protein